jgi:hypothetical protein
VADQDTRIIMFMEQAEEELRTAIDNHGGFHSAHEGYGVIMEEVLELEAEVFMKRANRCGQRLYMECIQVAAMAATLAITIAEDMPVKEEEASRG